MSLRRPPDQNIGPDYLLRWYLVPKNRVLNIYLHKILRSDDDRACHDHPWWSVSFLLRGRLSEVYAIDPCPENPARWFGARRLPWLRPVFRRADSAHRLVLGDSPAWTLFITGPKVRAWGFWCSSGWRHWQEYCAGDGSVVGRGCD